MRGTACSACSACLTQEVAILEMASSSNAFGIVIMRCSTGDCLRQGGELTRSGRESHSYIACALKI